MRHFRKNVGNAIISVFNAWDRLGINALIVGKVILEPWMMKVNVNVLRGSMSKALKIVENVMLAA